MSRKREISPTNPEMRRTPNPTLRTSVVRMIVTIRMVPMDDFLSLKLQRGQR